MALAFEQRPKESDKAFAAFSLYLSLGPERFWSPALPSFDLRTGRLVNRSARHNNLTTSRKVSFK